MNEPIKNDPWSDANKPGAMTLDEICAADQNPPPERYALAWPNARMPGGLELYCHHERRGVSLEYPAVADVWRSEERAIHAAAAFAPRPVPDVIPAKWLPWCVEAGAISLLLKSAGDVNRDAAMWGDPGADLWGDDWERCDAPDNWRDVLAEADANSSDVSTDNSDTDADDWEWFRWVVRDGDHHATGVEWLAARYCGV